MLDALEPKGAKKHVRSVDASKQEKAEDEMSEDEAMEVGSDDNLIEKPHDAGSYKIPRISKKVHGLACRASNFA